MLGTIDEKKGTIIMLLALAFFIAGCTGGSDNYDTFDPYNGYEGIRLSFLDKAPPYELYEGETIPIGLLIENKGAYDVKRGQLSFSYESDYMTPPNGESYDIMLKGKSADLQTGESQMKLFYSQSKPLDELSRVHDIQLIATACYEYQTIFSENICIDTDYFNVLREKKACERKDTYAGSQGAPIAVTEVRQILTDDQDSVTFEIVVENVAGGEVFDYFSVDSVCTRGEYLADRYNKVTLKGSVSLNELECEKDTIKLNKDGIGKFRCGYTTKYDTAGEAYTTVVNLQLFYGYISTRATDITVLGTE